MNYTKEALDFLTERGIDPDIASVRLVEYSKGDAETVYRADPKLREFAGKAQWRVNISAGILIVKYPVPIPDLDPIVAQFRPFGRRLKRTFLHDHAMYTPTVRRLHVKSPKWGHAGEDPNGEHEHKEFYGKYMLMPAPRQTYLHTHDVAELADKIRRRGQAPAHQLAEEAFAGHIAKKPHPDGVDGAHLHEARDPDPDQSPEMRLDMHPRAGVMLSTARRVFFSIEGSIKGDALLSAGECSFSVPSVTMWRAPELREFANTYLADSAVFVVCDSDWTDNPQVSLQAFECRQTLRRYIGPNVHVVAAPAPNGEKVGIDDYLGAGGKIDHLIDLDREKSAGFLAWEFRHLQEASQLGRGRESAQNDVSVLWWMALHADRGGVALRAAPIISKYCGLDETTVGRAVQRLVAEGALTANVRPEMLEVRDRYVRARREGKLRRKPLHIGESWDPEAEFTVREDLRASERPTSTLAQLSSVE